MGLVHAQNLAGHPGVDEVVLLGRDRSRMLDAADRVRGSRATTSLAHLECAEIGDGPLPAGLDGLVVATTTASHPEYARRAAREGIPALVEKPLALDLPELETLVGELRDAGATIMVGFHRRYDDGYRALRARVRDGDVGTLRLVRGTSLDHHPLADSYIPVSGGVWRDLLIHDFDIVPWLTGDRVVTVQAFGSVLDDPTYARYDDADTAVAVLGLESGAIATLSGSRRNGAGQDVRTELYGTRGAFEAGWDDALPLISTEPGIPAPTRKHDDFIARFRAAFANEVDHFVELIRGQVDNITPPEASIPSLRVAQAAETSFRESRPVDVVQ